MIKTIVLIAMLLIAGFVSAGVYKWVDKDGNIHYSDTAPPHGQAQELELPETSRYKPRVLPSKTPQAGSVQAQPDSGEAEKPTSYPTVEIVQPENAGTVRSNQGDVTVEVQLDPALAEGHVLAFVLDGEAIPDKVASTSFQIKSVDRGTHSLVATVQDEQGKELGRSSTISFTLRKTSLLERGDAAKKAAAKAKSAPKAPTDPTSPDTFVPSSKGLSTTPGRTNPAFAPNYNP